MLAPIRFETPILVYVRSTWLRTVFSLSTSLAAISLLLAPCATSRSTSTSRAVRPCGRAFGLSGA